MLVIPLCTNGLYCAEHESSFFEIITMCKNIIATHKSIKENNTVCFNNGASHIPLMFRCFICTNWVFIYVIRTK